MNLLNLRNPVTGDFVIPAPRAGGPVIGNDITAGPSVGGNPFVRQRNVVPAEFTQDQYTLKLDGQVTHEQPPQRHRLLRGVSRPRSVPGSVQPGVALHAEARRSQRHGGALRHAHLGREQGQRDARRHVLPQQLPAAGRSVPRAHQRRASASTNPATFYDSSIATTRLGHYVGRPGRHDGALLVRRSERQLQQAAAANLDHRRHAELDDVVARASHGRRVPAQRVQHQPARGTGDGVREVRQLHDAASRPGDRRRHAVRHHRQAVPLQRLQHVRLRRLAAVAVADAESRRALRVLRTAGGGQRPDRQRRLRGASRTPRIPSTRSSSRRTCRTPASPQSTRRSRPPRGRTTTTRSRARTGTTSRRVWGLPGRRATEMGRARRLRHLLRSAVGGVHQHRVQQLPVPPRAGSHVPGERGAAERRVVAAGSELPVQSVPAESDRADRRRERHLSDPRRHERDAGRRRHVEPDRSGHRAADARQHRRDVRVPRRRPGSAARRTSSSTTSACSASSGRT